MNPTEIDIAIHEALGHRVEPCTCTRPSGKDAATGKHVPNYHGDLNAMHEAEATMDKDECFLYHDTLRQNLPSRADMKVRAELWTFHATAAQRAEAFLRTVGKWKEGA